MEKGIMRKSYEKVRSHVVDTTAVLVASNPIFTLSENVLSGMSDKLSIDNRINGSLLFYLGAGFLFSKGREVYNRLLNIKEDSKYKGLYDVVWGTIFGAGFNAAVTATNSQSLEDIAAGAFAGAITGSVTGFPAGYSIDTFRDFTGISPSERLPEKVKGFSRKAKKGLAVGLIAASLAFMSGVYKATPKDFKGINSYIGDYFTESIEDNGDNRKNEQDYQQK